MDSNLDYDFIVIGSGFGGSVAALRLAEKGYRVAVIEKGKRYRNEDFPKTNWDFKKSIWMPLLGLTGIQGLTLLRHVLVLHGNGVGGGSLVYANQLIIPDDEVLQKPEWGPGDWKTTLEPHYKEAGRMLGAVECPGVGNADLVLREVGKEICDRDTFHVNPVGIYFGKPDEVSPDPYFGGQGPERKGCTLCGACMIGCPVGAKNTTDKNYLYLAEKLGVQVIPETEVLGVQAEGNHYRVMTRKSHGLQQTQKTYLCGGAVFSAGVLGTLKLLMECKRKGMLNISDRLGDFVRTNSEAILGVDSTDNEKDWNDHVAITSGIYPDKNTHIEAVRYNKGSDVMYALATVLTDGGGKVPRQLRFFGNILRHPYQFIRSIWVPGQSKRMTVILAMQSTENYLHVRYRRNILNPSGWSLDSQLPPGEKRIPSYIPIANQVTRKMAEKIKGYPKGSWFEVLLDAPTTAHILGGCVISDQPENGVVDQEGRLFGYSNLYVSDGSIVPVNLNVNPALTITALSEYISSKIPSKNGH